MILPSPKRFEERGILDSVAVCWAGGALSLSFTCEDGDGDMIEDLWLLDALSGLDLKGLFFVDDVAPESTLSLATNCVCALAVRLCSVRTGV